MYIINTGMSKNFHKHLFSCLCSWAEITKDDNPEIKNRTVALSKVFRIQNLLCKSLIYLYLKISAVYIIYFKNDKEMQKWMQDIFILLAVIKLSLKIISFLYGDGG